MGRHTRRDLKVGCSVAAMLAAFVVAVLSLEDGRKLIEDRYSLNGSWKNLSSMKAGSAVRLAGLDVGEVTHVNLSDDLDVNKVFVEMQIRSEYQERIRKDSVATIESIGLLGDKYVNITMGSSDLEVLQDGDWIITEDPMDVMRYAEIATRTVQNAESITGKLDDMLGEHEDAKDANIALSATHVEALLREAKEGEGLLHLLIYDKRFATKVDHSMSNLEASTASLRRVTDEIENGDGMAHEFIYGDQGARMAKSMGDLADAFGDLTRDIENDDSLLHAILYDPEKTQIIEDLASTAAALKQTSESLNAGEGTLGLLARDPELYEDLRALVGGAQRNKLLRHYIQTTIENAEQRDALGPTLGEAGSAGSDAPEQPAPE